MLSEGSNGNRKKKVESARANDLNSAGTGAVLIIS